MAKVANFIINSDYPMPAQVLGRKTISITIPAGESVGTEHYQDVSTEGGGIFRVAVRSNRAGLTFVGSTVTQYVVAETLYAVHIGVSSPGVARVRVNTSPVGTSMTTAAAETITVNLLSFNVP